MNKVLFTDMIAMSLMDNATFVTTDTKLVL